MHDFVNGRDKCKKKRIEQCGSAASSSREILFHFLFSMVFVRVCERAHITFVTALRRISIFLVFGFSLEMDSFLSCFACSSFAFFRWRNRCCCLCIGFISNLDECLSIGRLHFDSKTYIEHVQRQLRLPDFNFYFFLSLSLPGEYVRRIRDLSTFDIFAGLAILTVHRMRNGNAFQLS